MTRASPHLIALALAAALAAGCGDDETTAAPGGTTGAPGGAGGSGASGGTGAGASGGAGGGAGGGQGGGPPVPQNQFLYVANQGSDEIAVYRIGEDGALTSNGAVSVDAPGPLAVDPDRGHLYAGLVQPQDVASFSIDHTTGALTPIEVVSVGVTPVYLSIDATGGTLLLASYGGNVARTYRRDPDGTIDPAELDTESPGTNPHSILVDPSNQYAFVPTTNSDLVAQYLFDAASGELTPNDPAVIATGAVVGPRHLTFHPSKDLLYVVNEHADSVTTYAFDPSTGLLQALGTESTLPRGVSGAGNTCADIHVTPDGSALYASNRGHDSLAIFSLDATTGLPTPLGHVATEATPREIEITRDGKFVYSAGQGSDALAAYAVGPDGDLSPLAVYDVGESPSWVLAISVDAP